MSSSAALNRSNPFVASAPAPSAATAAREAGSSKQPPFRPPGAAQSIKSTSFHQDPHQNNNTGSDENNNNRDAGQLVAMSSGPRLNPHSALKEFNNYLLQVLDSNDEEKREIIGRLRLVVQAQRSAAAVRDDLMKMTMEFNETARTAEELRLALQESREAQRRLEHENRVLAAQVEDDRAKIASLVKLCRAEMSTKNAALGSNPALDKDDILLSIGNGGRKTSVANRPGASARSASASTKKPPSVSLRQASAGTPANSTRAEDGSNANDNDHFNNNQNNNNSIATTDIVAQVLQGSHSANQTGPESLVVALRMEADSLKQLLDEQRAAYEASRAAHVRVARDCDRRHYEEGQRMAAEIRSLSDVLVTSTKDLVETRQNANVMQRQLRGEIEGLVQRLSEAEKSKNVQSSRQTEELRVLAASERNKNVNVAERLRAKLTHFESKFHTEKDNLAGEVDRLKEALATAQETAARERRLRLRAEEHARLKSEGHESDLGLLRAQLRTLEKKAFFAHAKDLSEYGSLPPRNAPTEEVDLNVLVDEDGNPIAEGEGGADGDGRATLYVGNHHTMHGHGHQIGMDFDEDDGQGTASKRRSVSSIKGREASFNLRGNSLSGAGEEVTAKVTENNNSRRNSPNNNNDNDNTSSNVYHVSGRGGMRYDSGAGVAEVTTGNTAVASTTQQQKQQHARSGSDGSLQRPSTAMLS